MQNSNNPDKSKWHSAHEFWCASAATAAICFLTPRPIRLLMPLGFGYILYRVAQERYGWQASHTRQEPKQKQKQEEMTSASIPPSEQWQEVEEYYPPGLGSSVDETLQETFPASDPPSYSPGKA